MQLHAESFSAAVDGCAVQLDQLEQPLVEAVVAVAAELLHGAIDMGQVEDLQLEELMVTYTDHLSARGMADYVREVVCAYHDAEDARFAALPFDSMTAFFYRTREPGNRLVVRLELGDQQIALDLSELPEVRALIYEMQGVVRDAMAAGETERRYS